MVIFNINTFDASLAWVPSEDCMTPGSALKSVEGAGDMPPGMLEKRDCQALQ